MLSTFCVSFDTTVNNLDLYVIFILVTGSEIAGVSNIAISAITWCTAGEFQQRTAPELLPCGNAPFYFSGF